MKRVVAAVLLAAACLAPCAAAADQESHAGFEAGYEPGKVLVVFADGTTQRDADRAVLQAQSVSDADAPTVKAGESGSAASAADGAAPKVAKLDVAAGSSVEDAVAELEGDPAIAYAQPNYLYKVLDAPDHRPAVGPQMIQTQVTGTNDPLRYKQWHLGAIGSYESWDHAKADGRVSVAILDTGITMDHIDLKDRIVAPYDVVGDARTDYNDSVPDDSPDDEAGHGTHVAGIVAASADNGYGTAGVSYNANIVPLRVCYYSDYAGTYITSSEDLARAYTYLLSTASSDANGDGRVGTCAEEYNVRVANMSLGALWQPGTDEEEAADRAVLDLVDRAYDAGILTVCAAGNESSDAFSWPSDHETCVSVIALDQYDNRASYSNYGADKDIAAPGTDIFSTVPLSYANEGTVIRDAEGARHCYAELTGTSMASPVVAGVAAQLFAANPDLTCDNVKDLLYTTATDLGDPGFDNDYGHGKVNAAAAARAANAVVATSVEGLPSEATVGVELALSGSVVPSNATHHDIAFSVVNAGTTKATVTSGVFLAQAAGTATLAATVAHGGLSGADLVKEFTVRVSAADAGKTKAGPARKVKVSGLASSYPYTGKPIKPALVVKLGSKKLNAGSDYRLAYKNNVKVGTATVTVKMKGNYSGSAKFPFKIKAKKKRAGR